MRKKLAKKYIALMLAAAFTVSMTACTSDSGGSAADTGGSTANTESEGGSAEAKYGKIDIPGKDGSLCGAPIYIAYEKGFFADEGFDVNLISAGLENADDLIEDLDEAFEFAFDGSERLQRASQI